MNDKALLHQMFTLQQKLNDETNGLDWEKGYNKHGRIINWQRCIYMESAELIDSFNWKHWKDIDISPNWDNITIELVDIWHFIMSLGLEHYKNKNLGDIDTIVDYVVDTKYFNEFCIDAKKPDDNDSLVIVSTIEHLIKHAIDGECFYKVVDDFMIIALQCGLNIEVLYKFYLGKNVLNSFRQNNGYKESTYKKVWSGIEDNVVLSKILEKDSTLTADELYKELEKEYQAT